MAVLALAENTARGLSTLQSGLTWLMITDLTLARYADLRVCWFS